VDLPFSFMVRGQSFPAGYYDVVMDTNQNFVTLASETNAARNITMVVGPADPAKAPAVLRFDIIAAEHALRSIHMGVRITADLYTRGRQVSLPAPVGGPDLQEGARGRSDAGLPPVFDPNAGVPR
jgi:hypothetical protein